VGKFINRQLLLTAVTGAECGGTYAADKQTTEMVASDQSFTCYHLDPNTLVVVRVVTGVSYTRNKNPEVTTSSWRSFGADTSELRQQQRCRC
jgi:hypothetical protein